MKTTIYVLSVLAIILGSMAAVLWLRPDIGVPENNQNIRFGIYEDRELVGLVDKQGKTAYIIKDEKGNKLFNIPVIAWTVQTAGEWSRCADRFDSYICEGLPKKRIKK